MKTKEFIKMVKNLGFTINVDNLLIFIYYNRSRVAIISKAIEKTIDTRDFDGCNLDAHIKQKLFDLIVEYANTPIQEREEPKKYYLKVYGSKYHYDQSDCYLNKHNSFDPPKYSYQNYDESIDQEIQTIFTDDDIDDIPIEILRTVYKVKVEE